MLSSVLYLINILMNIFQRNRFPLFKILLNISFACNNTFAMILLFFWINKIYLIYLWLLITHWTCMCVCVDIRRAAVLFRCLGFRGSVPVWDSRLHRDAPRNCMAGAREGKFYLQTLVRLPVSSPIMTKQLLKKKSILETNRKRQFDLSISLYKC